MTDRFVDEIEQVRTAIGANATNSYPLGNSWGDILTMESTLNYQANM